MSPDLYPLWVLAEGAIGLAFGAAWFRAVAEKQRQANAAELYLRGYQALAEEARKNAPAVAAYKDGALLQKRLDAVSEQLFTAVALMDEWDREKLIYLSPEDGDVSADVRVKMRGALAYAGYPVPQAAAPVAGKLPVACHAEPDGQPVVRWQCDDCGVDIFERGRSICVYCTQKRLAAAAELPAPAPQPAQG